MLLCLIIAVLSMKLLLDFIIIIFSVFRISLDAPVYYREASYLESLEFDKLYIGQDVYDTGYHKNCFYRHELLISPK